MAVFMDILMYLFLFLLSFVAVYVFWLIALDFAGTIKKIRAFEEKCFLSYAVVICARNEEAVIGPLIDSLKAQSYPSDKFDVFVVAHNCRDNTADIALFHGAEVYVRQAPEEKTKSLALQFGLDSINRDFPDRFDAYVVFDADALAHPDFLSEINKPLSSGADIASGYYDSKNFSVSLTSKLSGLLYYSVVNGNSLPAGNLSLPVNVYGSGYACKMEWGNRLEELDTKVTDFEFSTRAVLDGAKLVFAPKAVFYAEMPTTLREALVQRHRWSMGDTQCFRKYFKKIPALIKTRKIDGFKQTMDLLLNPVSAVAVFAVILYAVICALNGITVADVIAFSTAVSIYCIAAIAFAVQALVKNKRKVRKNIAAVLLFPLWAFLSAVFSVITFFQKDVEWKETRHDHAVKIEDMFDDNSED